MARSGTSCALVLVGVLTIGVGGCTGRSDQFTSSTQPSLVEPAPPTTELSSADESSRSRASYVYEVIDAVQAHAFYARRIDFDAWRSKIGKLNAAEPITFFESLQLVGQLLVELGDHHSERLSSGEWKALEHQAASDTLPGPAPTGEVDAMGVGYMNLPSVIADDGSGSYNDYVTTGRDLLDDHACGWIVDLRNNHGGSVPPMLAAVAPLLGPGVFIGYRNRDDQTSGFQITQTGKVISVDDVERTTSQTTIPDVGADGDGKPVAVLTGPTTASAAEAIAIAFTGRPTTRSFGAVTAGVPTGNSGFPLSDGSLLVLTTTIGVDRNRHTYESGINPDSPIESSSGDDQVRAAAHAWIKSQSTCNQ